MNSIGSPQILPFLAISAMRGSKFTEKRAFCVVFLSYLITFAVQFSRKMAKKGNRIQVILECTEHKDSGQPGTSRYITTKNKKNTPDRIEKKKYNPILKKKTVHKEIK